MLDKIQVNRTRSDQRLKLIGCTYLLCLHVAVTLPEGGCDEFLAALSLTLAGVEVFADALCDDLIRVTAAALMEPGQLLLAEAAAEYGQRAGFLGQRG